MTIQSINPTTEEVIETFEPYSAAQIDEILTTVAAAQKCWRDRSFAERADVLRRVAALLRERKDELARAATSEMGKPITESEAEVEKCAWVCEYYAEQRGALPRRRDRALYRDRELRRVSPIGRPAGDHAVELSLLAGAPRGGSRADGGQRRHPQARLERDSLRAAHRAPLRR